MQRQITRDRLRQMCTRRVESFAASVEENCDSLKKRLRNAITRSKASINRKNKKVRSSLTTFTSMLNTMRWKIINRGKISPIDICLSRCSTALEDYMMCDTPVSIHSGRIVELGILQDDADDYYRNFSASSILDESIFDEPELLESALSRISYDAEHGDGRLGELFLAALDEQQERWNQLEQEKEQTGKKEIEENTEWESEDFVASEETFQDINALKNHAFEVVLEPSKSVKAAISAVISECLFLC